MTTSTVIAASTEQHRKGSLDHVAAGHRVGPQLPCAAVVPSTKGDGSRVALRRYDSGNASTPDRAIGMTPLPADPARLSTVVGRPADSASSVLARVRTILDAFDLQHRSLSLSDLSRRTGLPKSTARRLSEAMVGQGLLARVDGAYVLGVRLFEWGTLLPHQDLRNAAIPFMEDLHSVTQEVVNLAVLDSGSVLYLEKITGHSRVAAPSRVGGRLPPHRTALGKVLLAFARQETADAYVRAHFSDGSGAMDPRGRALLAELQRVRDAALGYDRQEVASSLACVAAPVLLHGDAIAAVSVSGAAKRINFNAVTPALRVAAAAIGRAYSQDLLARAGARGLPASRSAAPSTSTARG
jgi:DNA-binding IclR family transcriptional regulator